MEKKQVILEHFNDIFVTNLNIKLDIPILKLIYDRFQEEITMPNSEYRELRKRHIKMSDELRSKLNKEQWDLFEQHWEIINQMGAIENEQLYYFGWIMAKALGEEGRIKDE